MLRRTLTLAALVLAAGLTSRAAAQEACPDCERQGQPRPVLAATGQVAHNVFGNSCKDCQNDPPHVGWGDGYPLGIGWGWTSKYYSVGRCPGFGQCRPWNPLFAVPVYSGIGQTGPRRILLWPPPIGSPLYNNTPILQPYPPGQRPCHGSNCAY
jgi:hypothetical protein